MANVNRGKDFEIRVRDGFAKVKGVSIDRVHDQTSKYLGSTNICDFIVYKNPNEYYIECKSHYGKYLPFDCITKKQWLGLLEKSRIDGVIAGVMLWFIDYDVTAFVPIQWLEELRKQGKRSIKYTDVINDNEHYFEIEGSKKKVFFDYDMSSFLRDYWGYEE